MKYRQLGKDGPRVSAISMGRGSQSIKLDDGPMVQSFNTTLRRAFDLGINFFDSSDAYWGTRHEVLLGRAVKSFRGMPPPTSASRRRKWRASGRSS